MYKESVWPRHFRGSCLFFKACGNTVGVPDLADIYREMTATGHYLRNMPLLRVRDIRNTIISFIYKKICILFYATCTAIVSFIVCREIWKLEKHTNIRNWNKYRNYKGQKNTHPHFDFCTHARLVQVTTIYTILCYFLR